MANKCKSESILKSTFRVDEVNQESFVVGLCQKWGWWWAFTREMDKYSFPYSGQTWMDRPQQVYKVCPPKINEEIDQNERMDIT